MSPRAPRPRRQRSATEALLSIVLVLESLLIFFLTLVVFSLGVLEPFPAFLGGAVFFVILLLTSRLVRFRAGVWFGFVLQALLILTGIAVPLMYAIGAGFAALWIYCFVTGTRLDRRNTRPTTTEPEEPK